VLKKDKILIAKERHRGRGVAHRKLRTRFSQSQSHSNENDMGASLPLILGGLIKIRPYSTEGFMPILLDRCHLNHPTVLCGTVGKVPLSDKGPRTTALNPTV